MTVRSATRRRAFVEQVMGIPVSVHVRGPGADGAAVAAAVSRAFEALHAADRTFSTYRADSEVSRIRAGTLSLDDAGPEVRAVAELCREAERRTAGRFQAWLPGPDGTIAFDPTGLVKGWAVEGAFVRLLADLAEHGDYDAMVCAGGDVAVACARDDTPDWSIGIEDPRDRTTMLATVPLRDGAVATSGNAARGPHIVDPRTARFVGELLSATVVGPSLLWSDVYATAAFVAGHEAASWTATLNGHSAVLVDLAGRASLVDGRAA